MINKSEITRILVGINVSPENSVLRGKRKNAIFSNDFMKMIKLKSIKII